MSGAAAVAYRRHDDQPPLLDSARAVVWRNVCVDPNYRLLSGRRSWHSGQPCSRASAARAGSCGSGAASDLGAELLARGTRRIHLFLTHLHLDHLEGLRFFAPLWDERVTVEIWGPPSPVLTYASASARLLATTVPGRLPRRACTRRVPRRSQETLDGGDGLTGRRSRATSRTDRRIPHRDRQVKHRLSPRSRAGPDGHRQQADPVDLGGRARPRRRSAPSRRPILRKRIRRTDRLGTFNVAHAVAFSHAVDARQLVLFHHDPTHSDGVLEQLQDRARELDHRDDSSPILAREGMVFELA